MAVEIAVAVGDLAPVQIKPYENGWSDRFAVCADLVRGALGGYAVHIPYSVTWHHEHVPEEELPPQGWRRIASIAELPAVLEAL